MSLAASEPTHEVLRQRLESAGLDVDASELHGILCGLLCAGVREPEAAWLAEVFEDGVDWQDLLVQECRQELGRLFAVTREQLAGGGMDFSLLLPDDDRPLRERAGSASRWCQGFLYGTGLAGRDGDAGVGSEEAAEALLDIAEIARMDVAGVGAGEAEEASLSEIVEYLRVAAMLLWEEGSNERSEES